MSERTIRIQCSCRRAASYRQEGLYKEALRVLDSVISDDPDYLPARVQRGQVYALTGQAESAVAEFNRVLAVDTEHIEARRSLAALYLLMGSDGDAETHSRLAMLSSVRSGRRPGRFMERENPPGS